MIRKILCDPCGEQKKYPHVPLTMTLDRVRWTRIVRGRARVSTPEQRAIRVQTPGAEPDTWKTIQTIVPDREGFMCDLCNAPILPGMPACAVTLWRDGEREPQRWEGEYLVLVQ